MKRPDNFILSILCGLTFCFAFTSCENFLDGQNIKDQIIEEIEIANTNPTTFYVEADEGSGTVNPSQLRLKKNETFDVMFRTAESWQFIKWEVVDRETKEPVSDIIKFENETALETKGKLLNPKENLEIHAKAMLLPAVTEVIPSSASSIPSNQPIIITFNMPMEDEGVIPENSIFNFDNINITNNGSSISHLFQEPVFDSSKTVLTIRPNPSELKNYINEQNKENIDVKVSLSESIRVEIEEESLSLVQNEKSNFIVRYNKTVETTAPVDYGFFVTAKNISLNDVASFDENKKFLLNTNLTTDEDILKNRNNGTVYIYGKYFDEDSGVGKIRVKEKRTNNKEGYTVSEQPRQTDFYISDQNVVYSTQENYTSFILKYTMQDSATQDHKDGAIHLDITIYDFSENAAPVKSFTAIKDSFIDLTNVELYNFNENPFPSSAAEETNGDYLTEYYNNSSEPGKYSPFKNDFYEENLKVVKLRSLKKRVYANTYLPDSDFTVSVTYLGNTEVMNYEQNNSKWKLPLQVNNIANLCLRLKISDSIGTSSEKDFVFPPDPEVVVGVNEYDYPSGYLRLKSGLNISAWNEFSFSGFSDYTNMIPNTFSFFRREELMTGYAANTIIPNGSTNGVFYIYQNKGLWGNKCEQWFSWIEFRGSDNVQSPELLSAVKQRSDMENRIKVAVTIPASTWDLYDFDSIGVFKGTIDPRSGREDTVEKIKTRLERFSNLQGLIERGETSCVVDTDLFMDYVNVHTYYCLRGIKGDDYSLISNPIRVKGLNSEPEDVQHALINIKPEIIPREELNFLVNRYSSLKGYHHGSEGDNPIYYKGAVEGCKYFYPLSVYFLDTQSPYEESYYYSYGGDKVIVKMNGVTTTYNFANLACRYDENNYYGDSLYDEEKYEENYQLLIPLVEMDSDYNDLEITVTTNCGTSSTYSTTWERKPVPKFNDFSNSSNIYSDTNRPNNYQSGEWLFIVHKFNKTSGEWVNNTKVNTNPTHFNVDGGRFAISKNSLSLPTSSYIKLIAKAAVNQGSSNLYWDTHYSDPIYHWTGTKSSGDATDFLLEQNDFYLVGSDQPVLLHVISTKQPYETCKNWDVEKWERNHRITSEKQLDFSPSNSGSKKYKPVLTSLSSGDCYVIVAHFGDDHVEMSNVKQIP